MRQNLFSCGPQPDGAVIGLIKVREHGGPGFAANSFIVHVWIELAFDVARGMRGALIGGVSAPQPALQFGAELFGIESAYCVGEAAIASGNVGLCGSRRLHR